jgi:opacity protein-like surface antigen
MRSKSVMGVLCGMAIAGVAYADMSMPFGWYLEPNVGIAKVSQHPYQGSVSSSGRGLNLNVGYKFMPFFAAELGYTRYPDVSIRNSIAKAAVDKYTSLDLAAKGILPLNQTGVEAFAKIGIQRLMSKMSITDTVQAAVLNVNGGSNNATGIYYGLGAQYNLMPEFAVVVQWERAKGKSSTGAMDLYSAGVSYLFS